MTYELVNVLTEPEAKARGHHPCERFKMLCVESSGLNPRKVGSVMWVELQWFTHRTDFRAIPPKGTESK